MESEVFCGSNSTLVYARQGRWLVGVKSPMRDRTLAEINIPYDHYESASMYGITVRIPGNGHPYPILLLLSQF